MGRRRRRGHRNKGLPQNEIGRGFEDLGREMGSVGLHMGARCARVAADALVQLADALAREPRDRSPRAIVVTEKKGD